jgi:hypothetical protein
MISYNPDFKLINESKLNILYRNFDFLIPDGPELIAKFLEGEQEYFSSQRSSLPSLFTVG